MEIRIDRITDEDQIAELESIRAKAFGYEELPTGYYARNIMTGEHIEYGMSLDNLFVGGCIVSSFNNSLYIEQLFIDPDFQGKGFGKRLVNSILEKKEDIGKYYHKNLRSSMLECFNNNYGFYEKLGYEQFNYMMKKRLK